MGLSRRSAGEQAPHVHPTGFGVDELITRMVFLLCAKNITLSGLSGTGASSCVTGVIRLSVGQSLISDPDIN